MVEKIVEETPPFYKLNNAEIVVPLISGILSVVVLRYELWNSEPWGWEYYPDSSTFPQWFVQGRNALFLDFSWFVFILGFIGTLCLMRAINNRTHYIPLFGTISRSGYMALSWPIIFLMPVISMVFVGLLILFVIPIIVMAVIGLLVPRHPSRFRGNSIVFIVDLVLLIPLLVFSARSWQLYGD